MRIILLTSVTLAIYLAETERDELTKTKGDADYLNTGVMGNRWKQSGIRGRQSDRWHMREGQVTWNEREKVNAKWNRKWLNIKTLNINITSDPTDGLSGYRKWMDELNLTNLRRDNTRFKWSLLELEQLQHSCPPVHAGTIWSTAWNKW